MIDDEKLAASICRLCNFDGIEPAVQLSGMPRWNHRLLHSHELATDRGIELTAHRCPSCGFVSVPMRLSDNYYDDYVNVPSLSLQAQQFQIDQAREFVERFALSGRRVLEIGCGDGFFLHSMRNVGAECFGIEPSSAQRELACTRGLSVEHGILSGMRRLVDAPFDAFVTRQVFEHIEDIRDFLLTIRGNLRDGAVGLVEVPNLDKLVDEARFFDFIPEHINYFTSRSLRLALQLAGFEVLEVSPVQEGESLRALVRWQSLPEYGLLARRAGSLRDDVARFLSACQGEGKKVAIWGAGGKGLSMMAVSDLSQVKLLVDGDPGKVGLYAPVSHLRVSHPSELALQGIDAIIVMAPAYEKEIAKKLRVELAFSGQIILAGRGFESFEFTGRST
jgi:SAM-dependent methyltransferase